MNSLIQLSVVTPLVAMFIVALGALAFALSKSTSPHRQLELNRRLGLIREEQHERN